MRNMTIRRTGSAILAMVIGISSTVSPITAQAMARTELPAPVVCQTCSFPPILISVPGTQA